MNKEKLVWNTNRLINLKKNVETDVVPETSRESIINKLEVIIKKKIRFGL